MERRRGLRSLEPEILDVPIYKRGGGGVELLKIPIVFTFDVMDLLAKKCSHDEFEEMVLGPGGHAGLQEFWLRARGQERYVFSMLFYLLIM